jgi:hypothetical protein
MKANLFETVLEVTDGLGSRQLVPITVFRPAAATAGASTNRRKIGTADVGQPPSAEVSSHVGLWVGVATVNAVSEAHSGPLITNVVMGFTIQLETNATTGKVTTNRIPNSLTRTSPSMAPTPTGSEFNLRLLLHVDGNGQTRLLKQVIEMWQDGTSTNDVDGNTVLVTPGHYVLLTDDSLIGQFTGVSARDGVPVGRRRAVDDLEVSIGAIEVHTADGWADVAVRGDHGAQVGAMLALHHAYTGQRRPGQMAVGVLHLRDPRRVGVGLKGADR